MIFQMVNTRFYWFAIIGLCSLLSVMIICSFPMLGSPLTLPKILLGFVVNSSAHFFKSIVGSLCGQVLELKSMSVSTLYASKIVKLGH